MKKFFNFVQTKTSNDLYLYGTIVSPDDKWDESDVTFEDFKNKIDELQDNSVLNIYQNSPGGDCFACSSMISLLNRAKDRGITINAYIDGLSASCSSWISCVADNLYIYSNSMMMVHKPMSFTYGNADEMRKEIEVLDKIQDSIMIPLYMSKAKEGITEDQIRELVDNETWLDANGIVQYFNATVLENKKEIACCVDKNLFNKYNNVPKELMELANEEDKVNEEENNTENREPSEDDELNNDNSENEDVKEDEGVVENEDTIEDEDTVEDEESSKGEDSDENKSKENDSIVKELQTKLEEANNKIISLTDKIAELQPIINEYNTIKEEQEKLNKKNKLDEKRKYFKDKFEKLNARDKFETDEVQQLIDNCLDDSNAITKLSNILFDLVDNLEINNKKIIEEPSNVGNLLEGKNSGARAYGFK